MVLSSPTLYRWGDGGAGRAGDLFKVTQLGHGRASLGAWLWGLYPSSLHLLCFKRSHCRGQQIIREATHVQEPRVAQSECWRKTGLQQRLSAQTD